MSVYQMLGSKYPVVSIKNGCFSTKRCRKSYTWLDKFDNIVINFDNDEVEEASVKVADLFQPRKVNQFKLPEVYETQTIYCVLRSIEYVKAVECPSAPDGIVEGSRYFLRYHNQ